MGFLTKNIKVFTYLVFVLVLCGATFPEGDKKEKFRADEVRLSVIIHKESPAEKMTFKQMRRFLRGENSRWKNGAKVEIALMKTTTKTGKATARKVYKMSEQQLNRYWLALVFQGRAKAPHFFNTEKELNDFVNRTPGAIGILDYKSVKNNKKVVVDGKEYF